MQALAGGLVEEVAVTAAHAGAAAEGDRQIDCGDWDGALR